MKIYEPPKKQEINHIKKFTLTHSFGDSETSLIIRTVFVSFVQSYIVACLLFVLIISLLSPSIAVYRNLDGSTTGHVLSTLDVDVLPGGGGKFVALVSVEVGTVLSHSAALQGKLVLYY